MHSKAASHRARPPSRPAAVLRGAAGTAVLTVGVLCQPAAAQLPAAGAAHPPSSRASPASPGRPVPAGAMAFDLAAQPLKNALALYDARTSLSVFYPSALAEGKSSSAVQGVFTAAEALRRLLDGTGLSVQAVAPDAFVLVPDGPGAAATAASPAGALPQAGAPLSDGELVQSHVFEALCAAPGVSLGGYRLALRMLVGESGRVREVRLLDSTGSLARDSAILAALRTLDIGRAPADAAHPFVLLVRPRAAGGAAVCPPSGADRASALH